MLWTNLNKRRLSLVDEGMLDHAVTLGLVVQCPKCGGMWCHQVWGA